MAPPLPPFNHKPILPMTPVYTYRAGQKIALEKSPTKFVIRRLPEELKDLGIAEGEKVSSRSTIIEVPEAELDSAMFKARESSVAHHLYFDPETGEEVLLTDRVLITFREHAGMEAINALLGKYRLRILEKYDPQNFLVQLTNETGINPVKLVVQLIENEQETVEMADMDLNFRVKKYGVSIPTDPFYQRQWHLHRRYAHSEVDSRASSNCEDAWNYLGNFGDPDVVIGITDDGCDLAHRDFNGPGKFAGWGYFEGSTLWIGANPQKMYQSGSNHGTSCAGVAAAEADGLMTVGAAPGCRLFPIKWESDGPYLLISDSKFLEALNRIGDKVDVLSNSWGVSPRSFWSSAVVSTITRLAKTGGRRSKGIVFLFAAGNENCPIKYNSAVPIPYDYNPDTGAVRTSTVFSNNLVGIEGVLFIAALASNGQRSHYSNYGPGIGVTAPSSNVHTYWFMDVPGLSITTTSGNNSTTGYFGGTSSATPLVAGIAALILSANPALSALEVVQTLQRTASKDLNFKPYPRLSNHPSWDISPVSPLNDGAFKPAGFPDGTWSPWFGFGKADALAAVKAAGAKPEEPEQEPEVAIVAALVNPVGFDAGKETVTILNSGAAALNLDQWTVEDDKGRSDTLAPGWVDPGQFKTLVLAKAKLPNTGGKIRIKDPSGKLKDEVSYSKAQARKQGWVIEFSRD